jgi:hypothetical protein
MHSGCYRHPDKIVLQSIRLPSHAREFISSAAALREPQVTEEYKLGLAGVTQETLRQIVGRFSQDLRRCHYRQIYWPPEDFVDSISCAPSSRSQAHAMNSPSVHAYHRDVLVAPIARLLHCLRTSSRKVSFHSTLAFAENGMQLLI